MTPQENKPDTALADSLSLTPEPRERTKCYFRINTHIKYAEECFAGGYIGLHAADYDLRDAIRNGRDWFLREGVHILSPLDSRTDHATVYDAWAFIKILQVGDVIFYPPGGGRSYRAGIITSEYFHCKGKKLQHRRLVRWLPLLALRAGDIRDTTNGHLVKFTVHDWLGEVIELNAGFEATVEHGEIKVYDSSVTTLRVDNPFILMRSRYLYGVGRLVSSNSPSADRDLDGPIFITSTGSEPNLAHTWALIVVPPLTKYPAHLHDELIGAACQT